MKVDFAQEIAGLRESLELARSELAMLEREYAAHQIETTRAREALERLRTSLGLPPMTPAPSPGEIVPLDVNRDSGRPARGARRVQIEAICRKLGRHGTFRTAEVVRELEAIEENISSGLKSYTYAVMNTLEDEGLIVKQGRGTWVWGESS